MKTVAASRPKRSGRSADPHKSPKLDLEIKVRDFGPIRQGKVSLKPLTVFIGPNNSGKSYVAMLVHSILNALYSASGILPQGSSAYDGYDKYSDVVSKKHGQHFSYTTPHPELLDFIAKKVLTNAVENVIPFELSRNFNPDLHSLTRKGSEHFSVDVSSGIVDLSITPTNSKICDFTKHSKLKDSMQALHKDYVQELSKNKNAQELLSHIDGVFDQFEAFAIDQYLKEPVKHAYYVLVADRLRQLVLGPSLYLPSSRTGIIQGHKAISAGMVRGAPSAGLHNLEIPSLPGVVADFIQNLLMLPVEKKPLADIAVEMESKLVGGAISVTRGSDKLVSDINYGEDLTLRAASSAVSELAPLVLYIRHVLSVGNVLILEEPEVHLHPANQRLLARFLARLVRRGLNIVVTTHSPFMLEQLSHLVQASALSPSARAKNTGSKDTYLCTEDVAAYVFKNGPQGSGISPILTSEREGISQEEFIKVDDAMYDELMDIESRVA